MDAVFVITLLQVLVIPVALDLIYFPVIVAKIHRFYKEQLVKQIVIVSLQL